jgi:hypothetical protein
MLLWTAKFVHIHIAFNMTIINIEKQILNLYLVFSS